VIRTGPKADANAVERQGSGPQSASLAEMAGSEECGLPFTGEIDPTFNNLSSQFPKTGREQPAWRTKLKCLVDYSISLKSFKSSQRKRSTRSLILGA